MSSKKNIPVIAVDLAYKKPVAIVGVSSTGKIGLMVDVEPKNDIYHLANAITDVLVPYGAKTLVVTETPLMIHNINTAYMMARLHAMLEKGTRDAGQMFFGIHPSVWQTALFHPKKGDNRKKKSVEYALELLKSQGWDIEISEDTADALNIAWFAHLNRKEILEAIKGGRKFSEKQ